MGFSTDELIDHRQGIVDLATRAQEKFPSPGNQQWLDRQVAMLEALKRLKTLETKET